MTTPRDVELEALRLKVEALVDALARAHIAVREGDSALGDLHEIRNLVGGREGDGTSTVEHVEALVEERDQLRFLEQKRRRRGR